MIKDSKNHSGIFSEKKKTIDDTTDKQMMTCVCS